MVTTQQRDWQTAQERAENTETAPLLEQFQNLAANPRKIEQLPLPEAHEILVSEASEASHLYAQINAIASYQRARRIAELREESDNAIADLQDAKSVAMKAAARMDDGYSPSKGTSTNSSHTADQLRQSVYASEREYGQLIERLKTVGIELDQTKAYAGAAGAGIVAIFLFWNLMNPFVGILAGALAAGIVYIRLSSDAEEAQSDEFRARMGEQRGKVSGAVSRANHLITQRQSQLQAGLDMANQAHDAAIAARDEAYTTWMQGFSPRVSHYRITAMGSHPPFPSWDPASIDSFLENNVRPEGYSSDEEYRDLQLWEYNYWQGWTPPQQILSSANIGNTHVMVDKQMPENVGFPTHIAIPSGLSRLIYATEGTTPVVDEAMIMKVVTAFPPDRLRLTLIDPIGNGSNFAGLMHLGEHNPTLIGEAAWVEPRQIEEQLARLSEQMRTIIQKYLKRDFATMEEYNAQAVSIEEPYRLVVINHFPTGFSTQAINSLNHLIANGQRAGIYVMMAMSANASLPREFTMENIEASSCSVVNRVDISEELGYGTYVATVAKPELPSTALQSTVLPSDALVKKLMEQVSEASLDAGIVQVPFAEVAPEKENWWTASSQDSLSPVVGFHGARKPQRVNFGRNALGGDLNNGALIVGRVGSGKSTLLHSIIMGLATQYSPEELELYLIDSKQGIEFNTYARYQLPHAKAISVETEPEFTASVILRLAAEMEIRAAKFKDSLGESESARNISRYREVTGNPMPRIVLVIDEFQELYREDSARIREAQNALEQLIRQGRAYGIHLILATQTFGGGVGMPKSIRELVAVRISLMTSEADAAMIFQDDNTEARLLDRPGEAILNESFGRVESNQRFQTAWMESEERDEMLIQLRNRADSQHLGEQRPIVFIGGVSSELASNPAISNDDLDHKSPKVWLGSTIAIEPDYEVNLRQLSGANVLIVGKHEDTRGVVVSAAVSVLATSPTAVMRIVDAGGEDTEISDHFDALTELHGRDVRVVTQRGTPAILEEVHGELLQRLELDSARGLPPIVLILPVIDRIRSIRRDPTSMNSYAIDEFNPVKAFGQILAEGSEVGIHVIAQSDSLGSLNKVMNSQLIDQFDTRVVTQVSTEDSTRLIDNREAGNLGPNRAIVFQDDRNSRVKIKPYGVPNLAWMRSILSETEPVNTGVPV